MDLACTGKGRRQVAAYLERSGCTADRMFNSLNGDRQMYFIASSGRPVDVMLDRLVMCHTLDFRPSFRNSSLTLGPLPDGAAQVSEKRRVPVWSLALMLLPAIGLGALYSCSACRSCRPPDWSRSG
jgi:hypothetical protein